MGTLTIMVNEAYKGLLIAWNYKFEMLLNLLMMGGIFVGIGFFMGGGQLNQEQLTFMLIGYVMWLYASTVVSSMSFDLLNEAQSGTLEQIFMSPVPVSLLLIGRSFTTLILATIEILLFAIPVLWGLDINIPIRWQGLVIFIITMTGLFGFGFIIAGATLVFKRVGALAGLVTNALLFLNGSMFPVDQFPNWVAVIAKTMPTTQGIILLRETLLQTQSLVNLWKDGSLIFLSFHSALYFCGGLLFFIWCVHRAKMDGTLGHY